MLVLKFGGTSVGSPEAVEKLIAILKDGEHRGRTRAVVVSAFSGATDTLIQMGRKAAEGDPAYQAAAEALKKRHQDMAAAFLTGPALESALGDTEQTVSELLELLKGIAVLRELSLRTQDLIMSFGERLAAPLIAAIFNGAGIPSSSLDARLLVKTDNRFGKARLLRDESYGRIRSFFSALPPENAPLPVVTGFIASAMDGAATTLGRGGSDLTAAVFAAALGAGELEIWTDVDGILTADPKFVKDSLRIESISYEEAMELSHFGAKVIYPPTIRPAWEKGIPIRVLNTFNPRGQGTRIVKDPDPGPFLIRGISSMNDIALVRVQGPGMVGVTGSSSRLFGALGRRGVNIILITQSSSEYSICFAILPSDMAAAEAAVKEEFAVEIAAALIDLPVIETDLSIIAVVGSKMKKTSGICGKVFHSLGRNGINVAAIAQGSSEINISAIIARQDEAKALNAIHEAFFLSGVRSVNLFLLGIGLIGETLVEQFAVHREILARQFQIRINLAAAADSQKMIFRPEGLDPKTVKGLLKNPAGGIKSRGIEDRGEDRGIEDFDLDLFIRKMKSCNMPNTCFCDCTASDEVAGRYADILKAAIPIVTPNKRANAGSLEYYKAITGFSRDRGIPYLYETTVCAGLPVISTLRDLFLSGDRVRRIEAVLSGTLSYIFNNFDGTKTFSALVREAKAKGYTEPDPRDDLNAMDAARKALILARECGILLEFSSVVVEPILPPGCFDASDVDAFFAELEKSDGDFE
ncbi:MAG: bifunctional aspartate kinase/homoserine dehydrogenase I, partial [Treponema sp.]|nr:bifunctional aspartate kinase/homoserine dehydrogenase I [Treponema sp.]